MTQTLWSDISSLANNIQEGALFTLRAQSSLASTVTTFMDNNGWNPRVGYDWGSITVNTVGEGDDLASQNFAETSRVTLTPARYGAQVFLTDIRIRSDFNNVRSASAMELGAAFATAVDTNIATNFASLTGTSVGSAGGTLTWSNVIQAKAILRQSNVPEPYYCVLGEGQWYHLLNDVAVDSSAFAGSDSLVTGMSSGYYTTSLLGGVTFVISDNISGAAGTAGVGAMYSPLALAFDLRSAFSIEPERDASRKGWELNANLEYAHGTWDAARGLPLNGTDVIPTT